MKSLLKMTFSPNHDLMTTVRLTTGGICSLAGLGLDDSEDCKLCVTEGLLILMRNGYTTASVDFSDQEGLFVRLSGESMGQIKEPSVEDDISYALLDALAEDLHVEKNGESTAVISFRFGS